MSFSLASIATFIAAYFAGSIPFGLVLTRLAGTGDLRSIGSGNIGATNVLRTGRKDLAAATLFLDGFKGFAAVFIAARYSADLGVIAAFGAFLGHLFPVWLNFKGGKGVATFLGCLFAVSWIAALTACAVWLAAAFATRYSSAAALAASALTPFALLALGLPREAFVFAILAALLWWRHSENIARLRAGTEGKIGAKA